MGKRFSFYHHLVALLVAVGILTLALAACGGSSSAETPLATPVIARDALGNSITIPKAAPQRIVSLTPLDSEILAAVGATTRVVAVDFYTDYPAEMASKQKITDGQSFNLNNEAIVALRPDLVLGYNLFFKADEQKLLATGISVVDLPNVATVEASLAELTLVGQLVHANDATQRVVNSLRGRVDAVEKKVASVQAVTVYMESGTFNGQYSTFGKGSYGDDLIRKAGGTNIFATDGDQSGYPNVGAESIIQANPQVIVTTEGAQFGGDARTISARPGWSAIAAVRNARIFAMDTNEFSRPDGPRLVQALEDLAKALHPEVLGS
jgi:iron complex transport system substrate-binding protein